MRGYGKMFGKMTHGELYDSSDPELVEMRRQAHALCLEYNQLPESSSERREEILRTLVPQQGNNLYLQGPVQFDYGRNTVFGSNCYANFNLVVLDCAPVIIGDDVFFGPNCTLATPMHPLLAEQRRGRMGEDGIMRTAEYAEPVKIGSGTWLASNVTVCAGVEIGENCVIGAGSVVTRNIPPNSLAAGVPCKVIRAISESDRLQSV